jgi:hypothetical protein
VIVDTAPGGGAGGDKALGGWIWSGSNATRRGAKRRNRSVPRRLWCDARRRRRLTPAAIETPARPLKSIEVGYCYGVMRLFGGWSGEIGFD